MKRFVVSVPAGLSGDFERICEENGIPVNCVGYGLGTAEYSFDSRKNRRTAVHAAQSWLRLAFSFYEVDASGNVEPAA